MIKFFTFKKSYKLDAFGGGGTFGNQFKIKLIIYGLDLFHRCISMNELELF
jgi:hypothetical protein